MSWHTNHVNPNTILIQDGDRLVGSMNRSGDRDQEQWLVEILWSGNDITGKFPTYTSALAFSEGVEAVFMRLADENPI